jgi:hypothetical protein
MALFRQQDGIAAVVSMMAGNRGLLSVVEISFVGGCFLISTVPGLRPFTTIAFDDNSLLRLEINT